MEKASRVLSEEESASAMRVPKPGESQFDASNESSQPSMPDRSDESSNSSSGAAREWGPHQGPTTDSGTVADKVVTTIASTHGGSPGLHGTADARTTRQMENRGKMDQIALPTEQKLPVAFEVAKSATTPDSGAARRDTPGISALSGVEARVAPNGTAAAAWVANPVTEAVLAPLATEVLPAYVPLATP